MRGHETPENHPLTILKGFSTVSEEVLRKPAADSTHQMFTQYYSEGQRLLIEMRKMK
jgi:hypothetical protein